jgi:ribosomal protein S18 acetylase RimI-like enzyme
MVGAMTGPHVRALGDADADWLRAVLLERWGGEPIVGRGRAHRVGDLEGFVASIGDEPAGVLTYRIDADVCEIVTLDAFREGVGVGHALVEAVTARARAAGARTLLVMTTNDNLGALRFYQRAGFRLSELRPGAVDEARRVKPTIPPIGYDDIAIRDELDLVRNLSDDPPPVAG